MAELIDKSAVVARLRTIGAFEYNDTRRNAFKENLDMIEAQPSTTEAEIRASAIEEFAEKCFRELPKRYCCLDALDITEIAEQLKEG